MVMFPPSTRFLHIYRFSIWEKPIKLIHAILTMKEPNSIIIILSIAVILLTALMFIPNDRENTISKIVEVTESGEIISTKVEISVPAIDTEGRGVIGRFGVEAIPGEGKTLANIDNLLYFVDTQFSIQTAKEVAANITGIDISEYNIIYEIDADASNISGRVVEGPSAGAALTIATIAALENRQLNPDIMITGSINPDGSIGRVGGLEGKMEAARSVGAKVLLVPQGQGLTPSFKVESECEKVGSFKVCRTEYKSQPSISNDGFGLIVREVSDISEALNYFLQ